MDNIDLIEDIIKTTSEPTTEEMDTFKNLVADWFKYDDAIRKLKIAIRERKTLQQALNNKIEEVIDLFVPIFFLFIARIFKFVAQTNS